MREDIPTVGERVNSGRRPGIAIDGDLDLGVVEIPSPSVHAHDADLQDVPAGAHAVSAAPWQEVDGVGCYRIA